MGIAAATHMELAWAILEDVGCTKFLKSPHRNSASQERHANAHLHCRWLGSTSLLCYGQMAMQSRKQILPWVDNIASRMVYYYSCSCYDHTLKKSFLSAAVMLMKALKRESSTQGYKFTQTAELVHCLLSALQKEPDHLVTPYRQKIILVIAGLSSLRPSLTPMVKSTILQTCFQKLYQLPPMEVLKSCCPALKSDPTVLYQKAMQALNLLLQTFISENKSMDEVCFLLQHTEPWLMSDRSHERRRAVHTIFLLLKCLVNYVKLTEEAKPSMLGHQIGLLMLLWRDSEEFTKSHARLCVCLLLQLLVQQKGNLTEFMYLNKMKNCEERGHRESDVKFHYLVQAIDDHLTVAQHTQLILTLLRALSNHKHMDGDLASHLLLMVFEDQSIKPEQVAEILQGLFQELPAISFKSTQEKVLKAVTVLGTQHTQGTVEVLLTLCHPSERQVAPLWKALATNSQLGRKVMTLLYIKLKLRPPQLLIRLSEQAELMSMLALGTIYELLYIREYRAIVHWAFAGILLGLLTQLHYLYELGVVETILEPQEDTLDMKPLGPCSLCLEALKGLFWTTNYWEVFAYLKLLRGWELFGRAETYTEGVILLARAMAHYDCEVKAVLGQAVICLKSSEERDNIVAILIITEFLTSQELTLYMSRKIMNKFLTLGLHNTSQLVRALSLMGLSSVLMQPKKVRLLRTRMLGLVESFQKPETKDLLGLMEIVGDTLHRMGPQGIGACSLKLARHLRQLFENEQEAVRGGAILLYGDVIYSGGRKYQQALQGHAFQSLVPLLFHLADTCPQVVTKTKSTFLRCAILLKWEFRKQLFSKLAWGRGPSAESDIFMCMMESNFGSCHQFLLQASPYLHSPDRNLKLTAMKFIGGILEDYFTNLCFYLKKGEMKLFQTQFEVLKQQQDSASRRFYRRFLQEVVELSRFLSQ
ncbi:maestro heat-like repeat family member 5 [Myotis myotis]|uniref:maestro heat-like repeat family member 5 n=1 Tax=Myotis myotis TaxID=51298 RepID=UPI00174936FF|nr:maestro heat-like repeat family member 5 [Myotis myotis]